MQRPIHTLNAIAKTMGRRGREVERDIFIHTAPLGLSPTDLFSLIPPALYSLILCSPHPFLITSASQLLRCLLLRHPHSRRILTSSKRPTVTSVEMRHPYDTRTLIKAQLKLIDAGCKCHATITTTPIVPDDLTSSTPQTRRCPKHQ